eukprot:6462521-Amphidinium_carterae.1
MSCRSAYRGVFLRFPLRLASRIFSCQSLFACGGLVPRPFCWIGHAWHPWFHSGALSCRVLSRVLTNPALGFQNSVRQKHVNQEEAFRVSFAEYQRMQKSNKEVLWDFWFANSISLFFVSDWFNGFLLSPTYVGMLAGSVEVGVLALTSSLLLLYATNAIFTRLPSVRMTWTSYR